MSQKVTVKVGDDYDDDDDDDFVDEKMKLRKYKLMKKAVSAIPGSNQKTKFSTVIISSKNSKIRGEKPLKMPNGPSSLGIEVKMKELKDPDSQPAHWFGSHEDLQKRHSKM